MPQLPPCSRTAPACHPSQVGIQKEEEKLRAEQIRKSQKGNELAALKRAAEQRQRQFDRNGADGDGDHAGVRDSSRKAFYREFKKVVDEADVILEVLDARDPLGCRSKEIEEMILNQGGKKVILVLNKIGARRSADPRACGVARSPNMHTSVCYSD